MNEPWFRQKQIGYGAGLPIHWKGWALVGVYVAALMGFPYALEAALGYPPDVRWRAFAIFLLSVPFVLIAKRKTEGGWRWRRGNDDG